MVTSPAVRDLVRDILTGLLMSPPPHTVAASTRQAVRLLSKCCARWLLAVGWCFKPTARVESVDSLLLDCCVWALMFVS